MSAVPEITLGKAMHLLATVHIPNGDSVLWLGPPGVGKTEGARQVAASIREHDPAFGYGYHLFGQCEVTDVAGFPRAPMPEDRYASFLGPDWLRKAASPVTGELEGSGLYVCDEVTGISDPGVQHSMSAVALEGGVGDHRLPRGPGGWSMLFMGNLEEDRSSVGGIMPIFYNRVACYRILPDRKSWAVHAARSGMPPVFFGFAGFAPDIVFSGRTPDVDGPFCTPRSFVNAARSVTTYAQRNGVDLIDMVRMNPATPASPVGADDVEYKEDKGGTKALDGFSGSPELLDDIMLIAAARIGTGAAGKFVDYLKHASDRPTLAEIMGKPGSAKLPAKPAGQFGLAASLAYQVTIENHKPICTYMMRMSPALIASFIIWANARNPTNGMPGMIARTGLGLKASAELGASAASSSPSGMEGF